MSLFHHGNPEGFMLFIHNFNITLVATGTNETDVRIQYLRMLVCEESFCQIDLFSVNVENTDTLIVDYYIKV